jgi:hypothetical protein
MPLMHQNVSGYLIIEQQQNISGYLIIEQQQNISGYLIIEQQIETVQCILYSMFTDCILSG